MVIKLNFKGPVFTSLFFIQKQSRLISYPRALQINQTMTFGRLFATSHSLLAFGKGGGAGEGCGRGEGGTSVSSANGFSGHSSSSRSLVSSFAVRTPAARTTSMSSSKRPRRSASRLTDRVLLSGGGWPESSTTARGMGGPVSGWRSWSSLVSVAERGKQS